MTHTNHAAKVRISEHKTKEKRGNVSYCLAGSEIFCTFAGCRLRPVTITDAVSVVNIILNGGGAEAAPAVEEPAESIEAA